MRILRKKTHLDEAILIGEATIGGIRTVIGAMDTRFLHGIPWDMWMGEKITRSFEEQQNRDLPVILFCCSGGARMQEGNRITDADGKNLRQPLNVTPRQGFSTHLC